MHDFLSVGDAAKELAAQCGRHVNPRVLTEMIYRGDVDQQRCPLVAGRRLIPRDLLQVFAEAVALRETCRRKVVRHA